jgi:hypothetical protein
MGTCKHRRGVTEGIPVESGSEQERLQYGYLQKAGSEQERLQYGYL